MSYAQATRAARESSVGDEGTLLTEMHRLDVARRIEHLLHSGTALRTFVGDDNTVATLYLTAKDALTGVLLRVEDYGRSFKVPQLLIDAGGLYHTAVLGDVAKEDCQTAILCVGVLNVADTTAGTVFVEFTPLGTLTAHLRREAVTWCRLIYAICFCVNICLCNIVFLELLTNCLAVNTLTTAVDKTSLGEFVHDTKDSTSAVTLLHAVFLGVRSEFTETRCLTTKLVDVAHCEVYSCLLSYCQQVEYGISGTAHSDVESHSVEECLAGSYRARQNTLVAVLVVGKGVLYNLTCCLFEELYTIGVGSKNCSVAGKRQTDSLSE